MVWSWASLIYIFLLLQGRIVLQCCFGRNLWFYIQLSRQNARPFADDTFKFIFMKVYNFRSICRWGLFVPNFPINNIPALVQLWLGTDKPLFEPIMVCLLTLYICHSMQSRVTLYTAGLLHTAVPHCSHSRAPIVHTAVPRENNEHGCVYLRCKAVCKLPGCVEGHPWQCSVVISKHVAIQSI